MRFAAAAPPRPAPPEGCSLQASAAAGCSRSSGAATSRRRSTCSGRRICRAIRRSTLARSARSCGGWSTIPRRHRGRVPHHRPSNRTVRLTAVGPPHHRPLRHRRRRNERLARRARRRVGDGMAARRVRLAGRRWTADVALVSRARRPVFTRDHRRPRSAATTRSAASSTSISTWMATFDSVLTRDSNGHHGVSVGDADGDGLDDLYVAQPAGLPNRLYRESRRLDVRGHHRPGWRRRPRRHGAVALRRRRQRRRSGSRAGDRDQPAAVRQRRQGALRARSRTPSGSRGRCRAC